MPAYIFCGVRKIALFAKSGKKRTLLELIKITRN